VSLVVEAGCATGSNSAVGLVGGLAEGADADFGKGIDPYRLSRCDGGRLECVLLAEVFESIATDTRHVEISWAMYSTALESEVILALLKLEGCQYGCKGNSFNLGSKILTYHVGAAVYLKSVELEGVFADLESQSRQVEETAG
jgi:hypothetical protein